MQNLWEHGTDVTFVQNFFEFKVLFKQPCHTAAEDPHDPLLASLRSYEDFPKTAAWISQALKQVLKR